MNKETLQNNNNRLAKNNLDLASVLETINKLPEAGSGGSSLNIFMQEDEPASKEGVWLQTDADYNNIVSVSSISDYDEDLVHVWLKTGHTDRSYSRSGFAVVGDYIYLFGGYSDGLNTLSKSACKFNVKTKVATPIADLPIIVRACACAAVGTDIYIFGGRSSSSNVANAYKYDTLTGMYTAITNIPIAKSCITCCAVGTNIYIIGGYEGSNYTVSPTMHVYNTLDDTYTAYSIPFYTSGHQCAAVGTNIYIMGSVNNIGNGTYDSYKIDTTTNEITKLSSRIPAAGLTVVCSFGDLIYFSIHGRSEFYEYNTITDSYSTKTAIPRPYKSNSTAMLQIDGTIYEVLSYHSSAASDEIYKVRMVDAIRCEDNSILIEQGITNNYNTQLLSSDNIINRLLFLFDDVAYYSTENGLNKTIPTYYGDGTQWIKFKN